MRTAAAHKVADVAKLVGETLTTEKLIKPIEVRILEKGTKSFVTFHTFTEFGEG